VVLRPTRHKVGHFRDVPQANLLAWCGKSKPSSTKAHTKRSLPQSRLSQLQRGAKKHRANGHHESQKMSNILQGSIATCWRCGENLSWWLYYIFPGKSGSRRTLKISQHLARLRVGAERPFRLIVATGISLTIRCHKQHLKKTRNENWHQRCMWKIANRSITARKYRQLRANQRL